MSSEVSSGGVVAAAVALPVGIAFGAGWLAWQGGKLLVEANRAADRQIAERKQQLEEAAMHRRRSALAAHSQLSDMCAQLLSQIEGDSAAAGVSDLAALEQLKAELRVMCREELPDDVTQIESLNTRGFLKLERLVAKQRSLSALQMESGGAGLYRGLSLADLMLDMKVAITAMHIQATDGRDVRAADPVVLERVKLNERLAGITERTMAALERVAALSADCGLSASGSAWLHSCFNGVDDQIALLYMPSTSNAELKKGLRRLEELLEQYDLLMPDIESEQRRFSTLYAVYADAAGALGETVENAKSFKNADALEEKLRTLKARAEKAQECAAIYRKLGSAAYICYAWDQELRALGYSVHGRREIAEMARHRPQHAQLGENKLPFYSWNGDDLTQLYSMTEECSLQVIVHDDGSVTMQAISDADSGTVKAAQTKHCSLLNRLHENLRKNWFVMYDYQEEASPDEVTSVAEWFSSEESAWKPEREELITEQRRREKSENRARQLQ